MRTCTTSECCCATAHIKAVCPCEISFTFGSAPWANSNLTASTLPTREAVMSGVSPVEGAAFASAPAFTSVSMMAVLPFAQATQRGVTPRSFAAFRAAPARISSLAVS